jgi:hypothetical protein
MTCFFSCRVVAFVFLLVPSFAMAQLPVFQAQTPTVGNSGNNFFLFLPVANVGSGNASGIQLTSVALNFMGSPAATVTFPETLPFTPGSGFLGAGGVRILDLEFDNASLVVGNSYSLVVNGNYQANGTTNNFTVNYSPIAYSTGFAATTHQQVLDVIGLKFDALSGPDPVADNQVLVAFAGGLPQVSAAGLEDPPTSVWVNFADGREPLIIVNNIPPAGQTFQPIPNTTGASQIRASAAGTALRGAPRLQTNAAESPLVGGVGMPKSIKARLLNAFGTSLLANPIPDLETWLHQQGYTDAVGADASVAGLRSVGGDGVFYISSHGAIDSQNSLFAIWTTTPTTDTPDPVLQSDLCPDPQHPWPCGGDPNARVTTMFAKDTWSQWLLGFTPSSHYGINTNFVTYYWGNFAPNSLVYIDTCEGDLANAAVGSFQQAIFAKQASVYAGWSDDVNIRFKAETARLVFDRLLGANAFCPEDGNPCHPGQADPPVYAQRPFSYDQVATDLNYHNLRTDPQKGATLSFRPNPRQGGGFGLLAPSISNLLVDEYKQQLTINGIFGPDPRPNGWVTIGGTAVNGGPEVDGGTQVNIASWDWDKIVVDLPLKGDGSAGNVQVVARLHKSNVAQLTEWRTSGITFTYQETGTLQEQTTYNAHFRADIRKYRKVIHNPPGEPEGGVSSANDSTAAFVGSGTGSTLGVNYTLTGQGFLANTLLGGTNNIFALGGDVSSSTQITFALAAVSTNGCTCKACSDNTCVTNPMPVFGPSNWTNFSLNVPKFTFTVADDNSATIQSDSPPMLTNLYPLCDSGLPNATGQLQWEAIQATPDTAPNPQSAR